jgi:predicted flap endonuclease-1-like 5' DNA nuclease
MSSLWPKSSLTAWRESLDSYPAVIAAQGVTRLAELDAWYRDELPSAIEKRRPRHATLAELVKLTEWKMARGVWRAPNLVLVKGNEAEAVKKTTTAALASAPHPTAPVAALAKLDGVGPATASALAAAAEPNVYPFFDELVAGQVPALGAVKWTLAYYAKYAEALRDRARSLGTEWTPVMVERAVWASLGGKAGATALEKTR